MVPNLQLKMLLVIGLTLLFLGIPPSHAAPITVPSGLNPGDPYRLVFVTRGVTQATTSHMSYYNSFVTDEAASVDALWDLKTEWTAIASTEAVDAVSNTGYGCWGYPGTTPVYNLAGELLNVNNETRDKYPRAFGLEIDAPVVYPDGTRPVPDAPLTVWTGYQFWIEHVPDGLSDGYLGCTYPITGLNRPGSPGFEWLAYWSEPATELYPLYAMSGVLKAPQPVPAPTSIALLSSGIFGLLGLRRKGRKE